MAPGRRKISDDVKLAAIRLYENGALPLVDILDAVGFSQRTFFRTLRLWYDTGRVSKPKSALVGRPRKMNFDAVLHLISLVRRNPSWFLDELTDLMDTNRFISIHFTTVHCELERAGMSTKKLRIIAQEQDEDLRANFTAEIAQYAAEQLVFLDETSKDERTTTRRRGRSRKGSRAQRRGVFVRGRRLTGTGALSLDGMIASTVVEGSMTRDLFLEFLEHSVVRSLLCFLFQSANKIYPAPRMFRISWTM